MNFLIPSRQNNSELLDEGSGTLADVRASLDDLRRLNRYLGGFRAITRPLFQRIRGHQETVSVLDVGTGNAALIEAIQQHGKRNNLRVHAIGLDLMARHLQIARDEITHQHSVQLIQADAMALPFDNNCVDYAVCSLMLHHLTIDDAICLMQEMFRCARRGIILSDLIRGYIPYWSYKLIQPVFNLHPITRHDGEVSIKRGFTRSEVEAIARDAGLEQAVVRHYPMFRMTMVVDK